MQRAGEGTRILNFLIDTLVVFLIAYACYKWYNFYVLYWGYQPYQFSWFFFGGLFVYYTLMESIFQRSLAKWFTYTKVVGPGDSRVSLWRVLVRSAARLTIIDLFFIPFLGKPLHDWASGTDVVTAE
jgi:uncharacterized RDD family membrane protein YckC